jgi:hypothetical protein
MAFIVIQTPLGHDWNRSMPNCTKTGFTHFDHAEDIDASSLASKAPNSRIPHRPTCTIG